jgi:hypothetical protein
MIRLKNGKKSERANKQANSKKEKRTTTTTKNTPEKASTTLFFFFFSFSFPYTMGFFSLPHIYNILMTQTVLGLWYSDRISLLFSLSKYVCDTIIIYIIILGKEKKRSESERVAYKNVDKYF